MSLALLLISDFIVFYGGYLTGRAPKLRAPHSVTIHSDLLARDEQFVGELDLAIRRALDRQAA